jgi:3-deoxy-manno-octulosonate cytidylyltransferase (CMP-KDO synthetase)
LDADLIVNVQGDLPLLEPEAVSKAVAPLLRDDSLSMSTLKTPIRTPEELKNPNVVKVVTDREGCALYFTRSPVPFWRDGTPKGQILAYRHIGLYVYRRDFLLTFAALPPTPLEQAESLEQLRALECGFRIHVVEIEAASVEVDTPQDLEKARALLGRQGAV